MNIAVVGTDEVGLSTAILLAYLNNFVIVVDDNQTKVDLLKNNSLHFYEPQLNEALKIVNSSLYFTTDLTKAIECSDIVYFTSSAGYSVSEVCQIFQASLKEKFRFIVNKSNNHLGTTSKMEGIIREKTNNFSIAYEIPYVKSGSIIMDSFFPEKLVFGVKDMIISNTLEKLYEPLFKKGMMLPEFLHKPHRP